MTLVELKDLIQDNFDTTDICLIQKLNKVQVIFENDMGEAYGLDLYITGLDQNRQRQGCHVFIEDEYDDFRIVRSIESAVNDNFPAVYIHLNYATNRRDEKGA